jgi:hypothetical protein
MVAEEEETVKDLTEENQALMKAYSQALKTGQKQTGYGKSVVDKTSTSSSSMGNYAYKSDFAHSATGTCDTLALASIPTTRSLD